MIKSVLFVCTGNICRSPAAAALFAAKARSVDSPMRVASAGVAAVVGSPPPPPAIAALAARGIDISGHRAQQFAMDVANGYDLILVMEAAHRRFIEGRWGALRGRVHRIGERRNEDVLDPYGLPVDYYAECVGCIDMCIQDWWEQLAL